MTSLQSSSLRLFLKNSFSASMLLREIYESLQPNTLT